VIRFFSKYHLQRALCAFCATGKLSPRYIGPFMIIAQVGSLVYLLQLPESMKGVHNVFHVSMLRKYLLDTEHKIDLESIAVQQDLSLECHPVHILELSERVMRRRTIKYVRVLWIGSSRSRCGRSIPNYLRMVSYIVYISFTFSLVSTIEAAEFEEEFF
jgi:hypothetical protein